ncbi:MAG: flippase [Chloroflexi bacterium]|nr:flippase [Chloroflexota bacterium]
MAQFIKATAMTGLTRVISRILGLLAMILVARTLGPEGHGQYTLAYLLATTTIALMNFGLVPTTIYYLANGKYPRGQVLGHLVLFHLLSTALALSSGWLIVKHYADLFFPQTPRTYLDLSLLSIPGILTYRFLQGALLGTQRFDLYNLGQMFWAILHFILLALFVPILKMGVSGALVAEALSWSLSAALLWHWSRSVVPHWTSRINRVLLKGILRYGFYSYVGGLLAFFNERVDIYLINLFQGPKAVGLYSVAVGLAERLWFISHTASLVLLPRISASSDAKWKRRFTPLVTRTVLLMVLPPALLLALFARPILVLLYSEQYLPAARPLQILLLGIVAFSISRILAHDLAGRGHPLLNTYTSALSLAVNVVLNLILLPRWGITGAAWASALSYSSLLFSKIIFYRQLSGNTWRDIIWITRSDLHLYRITIQQALTHIKQRWRGSRT